MHGPSPVTKKPAGFEERGKKRKAGGGEGKGKPAPGKSPVTKKPTGVEEKGKKRKAAAGKRGSETKKEKDVLNDSDGSIGGGDDYETGGAYACLTINKRKLVTDLAKIPESGYKRAFLNCSERKALGLKVREQKTRLVIFVCAACCAAAISLTCPD